MSYLSDLVPFFTTFLKELQLGHAGGSNLKSSNMVVRVFFFGIGGGVWIAGYFNLSPEYCIQSPGDITRILYTIHHPYFAKDLGGITRISYIGFGIHHSYFVYDLRVIIDH